jgi:hypothetical protein
LYQATEGKKYSLSSLSTGSFVYVRFLKDGFDRFFDETKGDAPVSHHQTTMGKCDIGPGLSIHSE